MKLALIILLAVSASAYAQQRPTADGGDVKKQEMQKLDNLVGKWKGSGWMMQGKTRKEFTGTEIVQKKVAGYAILVEGKHFDKKLSKNVVHETLAVLSYNEQAKRYDFQTYLANGVSSTFPFVVTDTGYQWSMEFPGAKICYDITISEGVWKEVGKISQDDGKSWNRFFEMTLKKQK
ncbi:MAG: hypothetical protein ACK5NT_11280 [Pyrinomonadaceae bacterium]